MGAAATFALMGAIAAVYGPLLEAISRRYGVSLPVAGLTLTAHFVGASIGVVSSMYFVRRVPARHLLGSALLIVGAGSTIVAFGGRWPLFLLGVAVVGVGFGTLDLTLNQLLARTATGGRASRLTMVNATYGVGAVAGPLVVSWLTADRFPDLFAAFAVVAAVLSLSSRGLTARPTGRLTRRAEFGAARSGRVASTLGVERHRLLGAFFLAYVFYVSVETSTSGWLATELHGGGYSVAVGGVVTAGFWCGVAIGRFLAVPVHRIVSEPAFVIGGLAVSIVLDLLASSARVALVAYPVDGLALAAVFPMGIAWYTHLEKRSSNGVSYLLFGTMAGGILGPGAESLAVSAFGVRAVPFVIAALAFVDLTLFAGAAITTSKHVAALRVPRSQTE